MKHLLYKELASAVAARKGMDPSHAWFENWNTRIKLIEDLLPSGSGIDNGTLFDLDASHANKLVFHFGFHHMDENGFYCGWTEHTLTLTPSLTSAFNLRISGPNRNDIKEDLYQIYDYALRQDITYELRREQFPQYAIEHKWENSDGSPSECYQAFYVQGERFWNNLEGARKRAGELMEETFYNRKGV